jgi:hypothetical protein
MSSNRLSEYEKLPSGKTIHRDFNEDGSLLREIHTYGRLDIAIQYSFEAGVKNEEMYFKKGRIVSRRTYEKARVDHPDMPAADNKIEDFGNLLMRGARKEEEQNRTQAKRHLAESVESRFPRPDATNWLRVISGDKLHLVIFASRDWKVLTRESRIPTGRHWLRSFGFSGAPGSHSMGLEIGYEVEGDRLAMLNDSKSLLKEVIEFQKNPIESSQWQGSIRPRPKPRKYTSAWPTVLPPLIEFLERLQEAKVKIFNHHQ